MPTRSTREPVAIPAPRTSTDEPADASLLQRRLAELQNLNYKLQHRIIDLDRRCRTLMVDRDHGILDALKTATDCEYHGHHIIEVEERFRQVHAHAAATRHAGQQLRARISDAWLQISRAAEHNPDGAVSYTALQGGLQDMMRAYDTAFGRHISADCSPRTLDGLGQDS